VGFWKKVAHMWRYILTAVLIVGQASLGRPVSSKESSVNTAQTSSGDAVRDTELATLGGGCFWCLEAVFEDMEGVKSVVSGYAGGTVKNPSYDDVCSGTTGHAEVVRIEFDPRVVAFEKILSVFFTIHDPTTMNRQGADVGSQYRSIILYHDDRQKEIAEKKIQELESSKKWGRPVVTEVAPLEAFYEAEKYHQDYFKKNPQAGYCRAVVAPKVLKFREIFPEWIRK
jgi:peptide-methionine (S)-S-oxide reductase